MARELELRVVTLVASLQKASLSPTPEWLVRPGRLECSHRWRLVRAIYRDLTGLDLPDVMRPVERREVDAILTVRGKSPRVLEVDEKQHFNAFRATTLRRYLGKVPIAFDGGLWLEHCDRKKRLEGGGFARPKPPLFPGDGGRHRQRAFRDALCDILPPEHEFAPTLRIADFEVKDWIFTTSARRRMAELLEPRLAE
jgi:hypothetical protein